MLRHRQQDRKQSIKLPLHSCSQASEATRWGRTAEFWEFGMFAESGCAKGVFSPAFHLCDSLTSVQFFVVAVQLGLVNGLENHGTLRMRIQLFF